MRGGDGVSSGQKKDALCGRLFRGCPEQDTNSVNFGKFWKLQKQLKAQ